jgi:elongation factor P
VLSYEHIKMGRGSANIKVKVKNVRSGSTTDQSFINGAKVNNVNVLKKPFQFLYKDDTSAYFMDPMLFEQAAVSLTLLEGEEYLKEGDTYSLSTLDNEVLSLELPPKIDLAVSETGPGVKGNSATNIFKDAILENGLKTKVPLFVKVGDKVRIDTRTGSYTEKAS